MRFSRRLVSAFSARAKASPLEASRVAGQGDLPTLIAAFLHFDLSFMLWVLLGALGVFIAEDVGLSTVDKSLVVAIPILSGSLLRIVVGLLSDRFGAKIVGAPLLGILFLPLTLGWQAGDNLSQLLGIGLLLGAAGASFAVTLPLASRWYPSKRQGLVMGVVAAGNSGTVIANILAPRLANAVGWHNVLGLAMLPLALVLGAFLLMAKDSSGQPQVHQRSRYVATLKQGHLWELCLLYSVTFGGYVGLASFLPLLLRDQYQISPTQAGYLTALAAFMGSGLRPLGGHLADRLGGVRVLSVLLVGICCFYTLAAQLPPLPMFIGLVAVGMACLGIGNGAVFQLVSQGFSKEIGAATGVIGAIGGLGGFLLPNLLGVAKETTGSFGPGFLALAGVAVASFVVLRSLIAAHFRWPLQPVQQGVMSPDLALSQPTGRVLMAPWLET